MKKALIFKRFYGGWSTDKKLGQPESQYFTQAVDFRKEPSQMSVLPGARRDDGGVVTDLVQNSVMTSDGTLYFLGSTGNFYKKTTTWSLIGNVGTGYFGLVYRQDMDAIYIMGASSISQYAPISSSPTLQTNFYTTNQCVYNNSTNATFNVNTNQTGSGSTTAITTGIDEAKRRYFQTDVEPLNKIVVYVTTVGAGDWTLTLHDGQNNVLGTVTVTNANMVVGANNFVFTTPIRASVAPAARTYHYHLSTTSGAVKSTASNDMTTIDMQLWADRLVIPTNGMHPAVTFQQFVCIGNDRYVTVWEPLNSPIPDNSEFQRHKIKAPSGYQVCGLSSLNEFLAIACEKVSTGSRTPQDGLILWWDGLSPTYNYVTKVPEGSPLGMHEYQNTVYYFCNGALYAIAGYNSLPVKVRTMPGTQSEYSGTSDKTIVYPYTSTVRRGVYLMGYPSTTTNQSLPFGVYSWGSVDRNFPSSFGYSYLLSTSTKYAINSLTIGHVKNYGDTLFISWQDNGVYGVDIVDNTSASAAYAEYQSLVFDNGHVAKEKAACYIEASFNVPTGSTIQLMYSINNGTWVKGEKWSSTNLWLKRTGLARLTVDSVDGNYGRFNEIEIGFIIEGSVSTAPTVTQIGLIYDDQAEEQLQ